MKPRKKSRLIKTAGLPALVLALTMPSMAHASPDEPAGINLGGTSFMDGFGRTDPGFVYQQYSQIQHFDAITGQDGRQLPAFQGTDIDAVTSLNQLIYVSPYHLLGGALGVDALLPLTDLNASFSPTSPTKLTAHRGVAMGDLTWGTFLQMPPVTVDGRPIFSQRFEFDVISPTGQYDRADDINPGSGFWSLNPFWAATILPTPDTEISVRLHYLHNFKNSDPADGALPFRAGDAAWLNFAMSYEILPAVNAGLNGYYFRQIQNDTVNEQTSPGTETTNLSLGPGMMYQLDQQDGLFANAYLPLVARNTTQGFHLVFRWAHVF